MRRDVFPAPRETDCRYGCCLAGDVGLSSELVRASSNSGTMDAASPANVARKLKRIGPDLQKRPPTVQRLPRGTP